MELVVDTYVEPPTICNGKRFYKGSIGGSSFDFLRENTSLLWSSALHVASVDIEGASVDVDGVAVDVVGATVNIEAQ